MPELWELLKWTEEACGDGSNRREVALLCNNITALLQASLTRLRHIGPPSGDVSPTVAHPPDNLTSPGLFDNDSSLGYENGTWNSTIAEAPYDGIFLAVLSVILGIVILITVIGNVFVIAAILLERNLQNVANYLIVSLAVADLMVACLVMPLGAVYEISRGWILGPELCDMWTSSDVLCCTASILHLVAIAVDRYWAVTNVDYIHNRNGGRIVGMIVVVWSVALVVSLAPQFGWKDPDYLDRINLQQRCLVSQDVAYQIFATCSTFYVPLLVILVLYWKIFQTARKRIRRRRAQKNPPLQPAKQLPAQPKLKFLSKKRLMKMKPCSVEGEQHSVVLVEGGQSSIDDSVAEKSNEHAEEATTAFTISSAANHSAQPEHNSTTPERSSEVQGHNGSARNTPAVALPPSPQPVAPVTHHKPPKKESLEAKRERKAAKTLAIITGAFVVCWLPFFIMALLMPLCESCYINDYLASLFLWLGYFNSTLNPVIYTIFSPEFRQAFKRILCGVSHSRSRARKLR